MAEQNNQNQQEGADQREKHIRDYFNPVVQEHYSGIRRQAINANNFEVKASLIKTFKELVIFILLIVGSP